MSKYFYYSKGGKIDLGDQANMQDVASQVGGSNDESVKSISFNEGDSFGVGAVSSLGKNVLVKGVIGQEFNSNKSALVKDFTGTKIRLGKFELQIRFDLSQPVNQWLCLLLLGCVTLSIVLFYFASQAEEVFAGGVNNLL